MPQVGAFLTTVATAFKATTIGTFLTTHTIGKLLTSVALSALSQALAPKPRAAGIKTQATAAGGTNPCSFILGRYATAGTAVCPPMSHGKAGKTPNAYLTYVIDLGDVPGQTLDALIIDDEQVTIGAGVHADYGSEIGGRFQGYAWVKYYDGSQTVADAGLVAKYASYPDRPWVSDMVGSGVCHAILTFRYNRKIFNNLPAVKFVMGGIPVYDPRADSTVGGSGLQRWDDPATWAVSENPAVQVYNILRGVAIPGGHVWGGEVAAADLPLSNWFAAMNACDVSVALDAGGTEPRWRGAFEVFTDEEPAAVCEELLKGCSGQLAEVGGVWTIRIGEPGLPVLFLTDDDIIVSRSQSFDPFPGLDATYNGIHASYPDPDNLWEAKDAPPRYDAAFEASDGDRRLVADLSLPATPYPTQVQRIMQAYIAEERRFRRHGLTLGPWAAVLAPLDSVAWTSTRNGYTSKIFEVSEIIDDLATCSQQMALRERNAADYDWVATDELPSSPTTGVVVLPAEQVVPSWAATGIALEDGDSIARRPAILLTWDGDEQDDVTALEWEVRLAGGTDTVLSGSTTNVELGAHVVSGGVVPNTGYEARGRFVAGRATAWTAWASATTPDVRLSAADISATVMAEISAAQADADAAAAEAAAALAKALSVEATSENALVLRPIGGTGAANIRIVEWDDETGAGSAIVLAGDNVIAPGTLSTSRLVVHDNSAVFSEVWQDDAALDEWENFSAGAVSIVYGSAAAQQGGGVLRCGSNAGNDEVWYVSKTLIPFDPDRTYRIRAGVYRLNGTGTVYLGFAGVGADGVTLVNRNGTATHTAQHYHGAENAAPVSNVYTEYTGYTKGHGATVGTGGVGTAASPGQMHPDVRYLRPMIVANYNDATGITDVDYVKVDTVSDATMIADGAITTEKIVTGAITAASGIIADATIGTAQIADLSVETIKIAGNAVTTLASTDVAASSGLTTGYVQKASLSFTGVSRATAVLFAQADFSGTVASGVMGYILWKVQLNGVDIYRGRSSADESTDDDWQSAMAAVQAAAVVGSNTLAILAKYQAGTMSGSGASISNIHLSVLQAMK